MTIKNNETSVKKLTIKGDYVGFSDFYGINKSIIYKNIIDLFGDFKNKDKTNLILILSAKIKELNWETELKFNRKETIVLVRDIMPHFENIEDYETCGKIQSLYSEIEKI